MSRPISNFGLARLKAEGAPAHPDDVYTHCGCNKCDARFRLQARAYYTYMKEHGLLSPRDIEDEWFPEELK